MAAGSAVLPSPNLTSCQSQDTKGQQLLSPRLHLETRLQVSAANSWGKLLPPMPMAWPPGAFISPHSRTPWGRSPHIMPPKSSGPFWQESSLSLFALSVFLLSLMAAIFGLRWTRGRGSPWLVLWQVRLFHCVQYSLASYHFTAHLAHRNPQKSLLLQPFG